MTRGSLHKIERDLGPVWPDQGWHAFDWDLFDRWREAWLPEPEDTEAQA